MLKLSLQTVKGLMKKSKNPNLALLSYRATPLQNGYSPAQLLIGRRLCTTVPVFPALLDPVLPDGDAVRLKEKERRMKDTHQYILRHRVRNLSRLHWDRTCGSQIRKRLKSLSKDILLHLPIWWSYPSDDPIIWNKPRCHADFPGTE